MTRDSCKILNILKRFMESDFLQARQVGIIIGLVVLIAGVSLISFLLVVNSSIELNNPKIMDTYSQGYSVDLEFSNYADFTVRASCPEVNGSTTSCDVMVYVALSTSTSGTNTALATRSMGMEVLNSPTTQIAVASGQSLPLHVSYTNDNSLTLATVNTPLLVGGSTWFYDFVIFNPPTLSGKAVFDVMVTAQLVPAHLIGHTYDLQANIQFPLNLTQ